MAFIAARRRAENLWMTVGETSKVGRTAHLGRTLAAVAVAAAIAVVLFSLALAFSNANAASLVARNSERLHWANSAAGSVAIARASLNQALVFAVDNDLGVASNRAKGTAIDEATTSIAALDRWITSAPVELESAQDRVAALRSSAETVLASIGVGDLRKAADELEAAFEPLYATTVEALEEGQARFAAEVKEAESAAGRTRRATQLLVTLLIPSAAIVLHQVIVRRQYKRRKREMDLRLDGERQLNKAKDELIAGLSHELRTPLTSIFGFSEYLLDSEEPSHEEVAELVGVINKDSAELQRMVDDLLTAARIDAGALAIAPEATDLAGVGEAVATRMRRSGTNATVYGRGAIAWADPSRVRQILRNLTSNALRHGGPRIEISVDDGDGSGLVSITVSDNGDGIDEAAEKRMFQRFVHDGHETLLYGSVGLGLAVVRTLTEMMGGRVEFARDHGWSRFTVRLPAAPPDAVPTHVEAFRTGTHAERDAPATSGPADPYDTERLVASANRPAARELVVSFDEA
jgi:signal transduction histidine kinase